MKMETQVFASRNEMGAAAGADAERQIIDLLAGQDRVRIIFAAAPSQNEVLEYLVRSTQIDWNRIDVFHMDEYIGLPAEAPQAFSRFLCDHLFDQVQPAAVHLINGNIDPQEECRRYSDLIRQAPIDIVCLGIGENGHIAFNDPPVADFNDPEIMKPVELDEVCRQQQVNDGCFERIEDVPTHALTLTVSALMAGKHLFCTVPSATKKEAVRNTLTGPVTTECPASILQQHADCRVYLDEDSAALLNNI